MNQMAIDSVLVEWGSRMFWPSNRVQGRFASSGSALLFTGSMRPTAKQVRAKIRSTLRRAPQVMVKITGGGRGMGRIAAHFSYISRKGELPLEDERGETIDGLEEAAALRAQWRSVGTYIPTQSPRREAFNIMLSMPPDTDAVLVQDAARSFAQREFAQHQYVFVLHRPETDDKTERPHVHLVVRAEDQQGRRLNPRKADLRRWRERFAEALQERGIAAVATRRVVHGRLKRAVPGWHKHVAQRGDVITRPDRPLTSRELKAHAYALSQWGKLAGALAHSTDAQDRETAILITRMVTEMPSAKALVTRSPDTTKSRNPDIDRR